MDGDIDNFMVITGVDSQDVARGYLQICSGDLSQAIQMFYNEPELQASFTAMSSEPSVPAASSHPGGSSSRARGSGLTGREDAQGVVHIDSDSDDVHMIDDDDADDDVAAIARNAQEEEDAAIARRLQEEFYGSGSAGAGDSVRAPIAQTTETLAGPNPAWSMEEDREAAVLEQLRARTQARRPNRDTVNPFNQGPSIWDDPSESQPNAQPEPNPTSRAAHLRDLFRPPHDIMSDDTWDDAREIGKIDKKWIMVNLQDLEIFQCQVLNRDVWKDEKLKALIKEHFIFLQYNKREARAQSYVQLYFPNGAHENSDNYPHVSIIDPRTGEQVKVWSGPSFPSADELFGDLIEFLDRYSLAANSKNPVVQSKPKRQPIDVGRLTEDEMLQLAMQNSLETNGGSSGLSVQDPDMLTKADLDTGKGKGRATDMADLTDNSAQQQHEDPEGLSESLFSRISAKAPHQEPENNPATTTRIQFRHSGGRIIRRFTVTDPIRRIYEWLKAEPFEGKESTVFELKAMPAGADLITKLDKTIEEAGLKQGTVMIEFIED